MSDEMKRMKKVVKLKSIALGRLNLAEYLSVVKRVYTLVQRTVGFDALGIEPEVQEQYEALLSDLGDMVGRSFATAETAEMAKLRELRLRLAQHIINSARNARRVPLVEKAESARRLYNVLKPCVGFYTLPDIQVTTVVDAMVFDLRKEENAACVAVLGLQECVDELARTNAQYHRLVNQRAEASMANHALGDSRSARRKMNLLYDYVTTVAFCQSVVNPSDEKSLLISNINAIIAEEKTAYKQRTVQRERRE